MKKLILLVSCSLLVIFLTPKTVFASSYFFGCSYQEYKIPGTYDSNSKCPASFEFNNDGDTIKVYHLQSYKVSAKECLYTSRTHLTNDDITCWLIEKKEQ